MRRTLITAALILAVAGCGGNGGGNGGSAKATGRAVFTVLWPASGRLIPAAANSIKAEVRDGVTLLNSALLARPPAGGTSTASFDSLPVGNFNCAATAFPNADGSGVAQATATVPLVIQPSQTTPVSVTMASTIDHLEVAPASVKLAPGLKQQISVTAKDLTTNIVLLSAGKVQWKTDNTGAATVDSSGMVTAVAAGSAKITATDAESLKSASATVTVTAATSGPISFGPPTTYPVPSASDQVIAGDFDGDGNMDVIIGGPTGLVILYGRGDGTLEPYQQVMAWPEGLYARCAVDVNNDGKLDIICSADSDKVFVILNTGNRTFSMSAVPLIVPAGVGTVAAGDFNGDARMDLAVLSQANGTGSITIFMNQGGGTFANVGSYKNSGIPLGVVTGDFNGEGKIDVAFGFYSSTINTSGAQLLYGDGTGHFSYGPSYNTGNGGQGPVFADFTGDGVLDLVVNRYWDNGLTLFRGSGGGNFGSPLDYSAGPYPMIMKAADFNRDGLVDLITSNAGSSHFSVLRSLGGILGFGATQQFEAGGDDVRSIYLADFNNDGKIDVVTQNSSSSTIGVVLNTSP